ncbi:MAG: hypothetical protein EZS28_047550, partial [Streblomastix strix]
QLNGARFKNRELIVQFADPNKRLPLRNPRLTSSTHDSSSYSSYGHQSPYNQSSSSSSSSSSSGYPNSSHALQGLLHSPKISPVRFRVRGSEWTDFDHQNKQLSQKDPNATSSYSYSGSGRDKDRSERERSD